MRYLQTSEYRKQNQKLTEKARKINAEVYALQQILYKKLKLLVKKFPQTAVHNMQYDKPKENNYFPCSILMDRKAQLSKYKYMWNVAGYPCETLMFYIDQIETANNL